MLLPSDTPRPLAHRRTLRTACAPNWSRAAASIGEPDPVNRDHGSQPALGPSASARRAFATPSAPTSGSHLRRSRWAARGPRRGSPRERRDKDARNPLAAASARTTTCFAWSLRNNLDRPGPLLDLGESTKPIMPATAPRGSCPAFRLPPPLLGDARPFAVVLLALARSRVRHRDTETPSAWARRDRCAPGAPA